MTTKNAQVDSSSKLIPTYTPEFAERQTRRQKLGCSKIWDLLDQVHDPELPGLSIWDLGVLQNIKPLNGGWEIEVTPTYSGCPAVETINEDILKVLKNAGVDEVKVTLVLAPAWTTEMISPAGKAHLKRIHIAPPEVNDKVLCPVCDSDNTRLVSQFGSTACKALYQCLACHEHFDYFKHF